jgi:hypothetical protein
MQLLDRVHAPELLVDQVKNHVEPFISKHGLSLCHFLTDYCKEVMEGTANLTSSSRNWQPRVLILLALVREPTFKASILLDAMRHSPIPWTAELEQQIESVRSEVNPKLEEEIDEQFKLMKLKLMVQKYGVKSFNVADVNLAVKLIPFILRHTDISDAISDALQCLKTYRISSNHDILVLRCQNLIVKGKVAQLESLLLSGSEDSSLNVNYWEGINRISVYRELDIWIGLKMERMSQKKKEQGDIVSLLQCGAIVESLIGDAGPRYRRNEKCLALLRDFDVKIVPSQLDDTEFVENLLDRAIEDAVSLSTPETMNRAYRIGYLLEFDREQLLWKTAHLLAKRFRYNETLSTCQELTDKFSDARTSNLISQLIDTFLEHPASVFLEQSNVTCVTSVLLEMSRIAVRKSVAEELESHLKTFKRIEMFHQIALRTDKGAYQDSVNTDEQIEQTKAFENLFRRISREIGLVMSSSQTIPLVISFILDLKKSETVTNGKGKGKDKSSDFLVSSQALLDLCISTRNFENSLRVLQLTLEQCLCHHIPIPENLLEAKWKALSSMLQNVSLTN